MERAPADEIVVRRYLDALRAGHVVDALDAFATDAVVKEANGEVRKGIREIAASFVHRRAPANIEIEEFQKSGDRITVRVRVRSGPGGPARAYQDVFRVKDGRVRSLKVRAIS